MESKVPKMRFVRCPKCSKLLAEYSDVPMYQCGGCNTILRAKHYTSNKEKTVLESPETNFPQTTSTTSESPCHSAELMENNNISTSNHKDKQNIHDAHSANSITTEKDNSSDVAFEVTSVFSLSMKDENWSYQNNSSSSSYENSSQTSADLSYIGSKNTGKITEYSSMKNMPHDEENEYSTPSNSFISSKQRYKSSRKFIRGVHSRNSSISTNQMSMTSLGSESFYSVRSRIECENELLFESPSMNYPKNNRRELLKMVEKLKNQVEGLCKTKEQNRRMYNFLIENANSGPSKKYVVPISNGAPFVICCKCFETMHIPVDVFKRTRRLINKFKCGSCLEVLRLQFASERDEKLHVSADNDNVAEDVESVSIENEVSACESSGAEVESALEASKDVAVPEVKYTLHQLMGYLSAKMLLQ